MLRYSSSSPFGIWLSPSPAQSPQAPSCAQTRPRTRRPCREKSLAANPVDLGSGNMYCPCRIIRRSGRTRLPSPATTTAWPCRTPTPSRSAATGGTASTAICTSSIRPPSMALIAERETGQYVSFSSSSGTYTTDSDLDYSLTKCGTHLDADRPRRHG